MKDKRDLILERLQDRCTSADAILNHLHQNGWQVVPKDAPCARCEGKATLDTSLIEADGWGYE